MFLPHLGLLITVTFQQPRIITHLPLTVSCLSHLQAVLLRLWRHDPVHAEVLNKLTVVVCDVPDGNNGNAELGVRASVAAFYAIQCIVRRQRGKNAVAVIE